MINIVPTYNIAVCEQINQTHSTISKNSLVYSQEFLPEYKIVALGNTSDDFRYKVDDVIISNSIPTKLNLKNKTYYLIKNEHIAGKIL